MTFLDFCPILLSRKKNREGLILLEDFKFIPSKEIISILDGISSGLGDDTKQILQRENINPKYSNSKKDLKWDLLHRNIRQNLRGSHIMAEFAKVPGWKILPLFDTIEGNLYLLMKEYRFNNILKTRKKRSKDHYMEELVKTFNRGLEDFQQISFVEKDDLPTEVSKVLSGILSDISLDKELIQHFAVILFDDLNDELISVRCCILDSNFNIVQQANWSQYIKHTDSIIIDKVTPEESLPSMLPNLDLTEKAKKKIGQNEKHTEKKSVDNDQKQNE